jgi:hypothetical protein
VAGGNTDKVAGGAGLPDLIRSAIGSGLRIGRLCAVHSIDLNVDGIPVVTEHKCAWVPVRQNVYPVNGKAWPCRDRTRPKDQLDHRGAVPGTVSVQAESETCQWPVRSA